jgi:SAM-dependent methyltransferase
MNILPPGTILQLMYLRERLTQLTPGSFIEIGPGSGEITRLLLDHGWTGYSFDLEEKTIMSLKSRFSNAVDEGRLMPVIENYLCFDCASAKVDLVISCMVMEHMDEESQHSFMTKSKSCLKPGGMLIGLVPASPAHWGIEDDIAGHYRRYTREDISALAVSNNWNLQHITGLTYPVSNVLLPISNFLVNRSERKKLSLSLLARTKASGRRTVLFKTHFPSVLGLILNRFTLFPFYLLQKYCAKSKSALVIYFELKLIASENNP